MRIETIEEFKARGGYVHQVKQGGKTTSTASNLTQRDSKLIALKLLLKQTNENHQSIRQIETAITDRIDILKAL